jgi:Methylamine utilisation protein MauE/AhpC/TSA family
MLTALGLALAGVFVVAAWAKLRHPERSRTGIAALGLPDSIVAPVSVALPAVELVVAALLLIEPLRETGAVAALGLLGLFTAVLVTNLLRGRRPACACFGALANAPIGWTSVGRNVALMVVAGSLIWLPQADLEVPVPSSTLLAMVGAGVGLAWLVLLTRQNGRLLARLEHLERQTSAPPAQPTAALGPLAIGATVPPLRLNDARGRAFDLAGLRGRPVLLLFLDRGCGHCRPLLAELRAAELDDAGARLVVISESASLRHDLPPDITLVVDVGWTTRELFGVRGTPAAASIDTDGALVHAGVHGTSAVRAALLHAGLLHEETDHELASIR